MQGINPGKSSPIVPFRSNFFLLKPFFVLVRNDLNGDEAPMSADIAYALHNVPSILMIEDWTPEVSQSAWREVWGKAGFRGCRAWFEQVDEQLRKRVESGFPLLGEFKFF